MGGNDGGGRKVASRPESCKSYAYDDGPYKSDARLVKLTCHRRRRKIKTRRLATFSPARLHYAIFSATTTTTNSRRTPRMHSAYTRRATRFHAAPECHGVAERHGGFRFHYNPLKRARCHGVRRLVNIPLRQRERSSTLRFFDISRIAYTVSRAMNR